MKVQAISNILRNLKIKPNKLKGQNFLVDESVLSKIVETADIKKGETVVEIGPGLGVLTSALLRSGANIIAIEQERIFGEYLRKKFKGQSLDVIIGNAIFIVPQLRLPAKYKVVSNLPYSITSPIINAFLLQGCHCEPLDYARDKLSRSNLEIATSSLAGLGTPRNDICRPQEMILMVQKEVGERLTAPPGDSRRGILTVLIEALGKAEYIQTVGEDAFYPRPKIKSAIIKINCAHSPIPAEKIEALLQFAKIGFSKKRAKLKNAFKGKIDDATSLLALAKINLDNRAEELSADDWSRLAELCVLSKIR